MIKIFCTENTPFCWLRGCAAAPAAGRQSNSNQVQSSPLQVASEIAAGRRAFEPTTRTPVRLWDTGKTLIEILKSPYLIIFWGQVFSWFKTVSLTCIPCIPTRNPKASTRFHNVSQFLSLHTWKGGLAQLVCSKAPCDISKLQLGDHLAPPHSEAPLLSWHGHPTASRAVPR